MTTKVKVFIGPGTAGMYTYWQANARLYCGIAVRKLLETGIFVVVIFWSSSQLSQSCPKLAQARLVMSTVFVFKET